MPHYMHAGNVPAKRHTQFRKQDGSLYAEELIGAEGFSGIQSTAYHIYPPTVVDRVEDPIPINIDYIEFNPLLHRHIIGFDVESSGDWLSSRSYVMGNDDVILAVATPTEEMDYFYRNAVADEMVFVHAGEGELRSMFGTVAFSKGDYVHVPRTISHQWKFTGNVAPRLLVIESNSEISTPKRYRNNVGQLLEHSPYCERDFHGPVDLNPIDETGEFEVRVAKTVFLLNVTLDLGKRP